LSKRRNAVCIILPPLFHSRGGCATDLREDNVHDLFFVASGEMTGQN
jgi:hypothetical protein